MSIMLVETIRTQVTAFAADNMSIATDMTGKKHKKTNIEIKF